MLYLQADHLFYENMGSEEACIESMTRHVQRVNSIYNPIGKSFGLTRERSYLRVEPRQSIKNNNKYAVPNLDTNTSTRAQLMVKLNAIIKKYVKDISTSFCKVVFFVL